MPRKPSKQEQAHDFRHALGINLAKADSILREFPFVLDHPVYGDSESALHYFATGNQNEIVSWLIARGANPNGITDDDSPIHAAAQLGHLKTVRVLIESGVDKDAKDFLEETALHKASSNGHLEVIELLLQAGADPSVSGMYGDLAIDQALPRKAEQIRSLFESYSARQRNNA